MSEGRDGRRDRGEAPLRVRHRRGIVADSDRRSGVADVALVGQAVESVIGVSRCDRSRVGLLQQVSVVVVRAVRDSPALGRGRTGESTQGIVNEGARLPALRHMCDMVEDIVLVAGLVGETGGVLDECRDAVERVGSPPFLLARFVGDFDFVAGVLVANGCVPRECDDRDPVESVVVGDRVDRRVGGAVGVGDFPEAPHGVVA